MQRRRVAGAALVHHADPSRVSQPHRVVMTLECSTGELLARAAFMLTGVSVYNKAHQRWPGSDSCSGDKGGDDKWTRIGREVTRSIMLLVYDVHGLSAY